MKKIWNIVQYVILILLLLGMINSISLGDLRLIFKGILLILFWSSMILENKSPKKNKAITITFQVSGTIVVILTIMSLFFGFQF